MANRILVTGASGFVGRALVSELANRRYHVLRHDSCDGDIASCAFPNEAVEHVFHLAGRSYVPESWERPLEFYRTNVLGCVNVLELCRRRGSSMTFVSSYVYGNPERLPISEEHPRLAVNPYAQSKMLAEDVCQFYADKFAIPICIVRPFNLYGPGQAERFLIPSLVGQALYDPAHRITVADARPRRDFLYISDFVELLLLTLGSRAAGIYNAGSGESVSIRDAVDVLITVVGERTLVSRNERRRDEILEVRADIGKAKRELGWEPVVSFREGIVALVDAYRGYHARPSGPGEGRAASGLTGARERNEL